MKTYIRKGKILIEIDQKDIQVLDSCLAKVDNILGTFGWMVGSWREPLAGVTQTLKKSVVDYYQDQRNKKHGKETS